MGLWVSCAGTVKMEKGDGAEDVPMVKDLYAAERRKAKVGALGGKSCERQEGPRAVGVAQ
jgi:hypothetical protein